MEWYDSCLDLIKGSSLIYHFPLILPPQKFKLGPFVADIHLGIGINQAIFLLCEVLNCVQKNITLFETTIFESILLTGM